jgi:carbamoyl-phosphate synthase large subunit
MDSLIPSILNEAINERNICSSETLGLREGFLSAAMMPIYHIPTDKFPNVDKSLGPEMKSTGESIYFIKDLKDPFFRQVYGERSMYLSR